MPVRLSSAPRKCCQNRVPVDQYHMTSSRAQMLTHRSFRTILKKQEMLTLLHGYIIGQGRKHKIKAIRANIICRLIVALKTILIVDGWYYLHFREGVIKMVDLLTFRLLSRSLWEKKTTRACCILYKENVAHLMLICSSINFLRKMRFIVISPITKSISLPPRHS